MLEKQHDTLEREAIEVWNKYLSQGSTFLIITIHKIYTHRAINKWFPCYLRNKQTKKPKQNETKLPTTIK